MLTESDVVRLRRAARRAAKLGAGFVLVVSDGRFDAMPTEAENPAEIRRPSSNHRFQNRGRGRPHIRGKITLEFEIAATKLMCNSTFRSGVTHSDRITLNVPSCQRQTTSAIILD